MRVKRRTPMTFLAPALAANMQRIPVPHPTSRTTLSLSSPSSVSTQSSSEEGTTHLKRCLFHHIELRYDKVRTSSFSISSWIPK